MLRKLVSSFIVLVLATLGLSQTSPALAEGNFSPVVAMPEGSTGGMSIPLGDNDQLKIWQGYDDNGHYLRTGILHQDGTWSNHDDLVATPTTTVINLAYEGGWTVNQEGTIAVTWIQSFTTRQNAVDFNTSSSYIAYTDDGVNWSAPVQLFAPRVVSGNFYECMMYERCGYNSIQLAVDAKNTITALAKFFDGSNWSLLVSSSHEGVIWSAPTELDSGQGSYFSQVSISAVPAGGFIAVWSTGGQNAVFRFSTMSPKTYTVWQRPKTLGSALNVDRSPILLQTDPTHFSLFFLTSENLISVLHQQIYALATKTWSAATTLFTGPDQWWTSGFSASLGANWHSVVAVGVVQNDVAAARAYLVELKNSVAGEGKLVKSATEQSMQIDALRVNFDDSVTLMLNGLNRRANIMNLKAGVVVNDVDVPTTGAEQLYGFGVSTSSSGNIFIGSVFNTGTSQIYEGIVYRQASAPVASGTLTLAGVAKAGKFVTAVAPAFTGLTAVGATTIQWYSCTTATPTVQLTIPLSCTAIPKATSLKFKVTSKLKNKFLGVAASNTNAVGNTNVFITFATKAK